ncbi:hypothetical protein G5B47_02615 [Paenibacillus sp. 7124]|uniref:HNH endonuclease n=1 Tax=Paenibacillus apii TaxID=1850370 RepID=A0A6M1PLT1_9BACL|nr:hypothetical protein [Paenibacillus apii]NGM81301.1 hypothetical protein [Paenibacillus apii]
MKRLKHNKVIELKNKEKVMPVNMDEFWSIPNLVDMNGTERSFSDYFVHSQTGNIWSCKSGRYLKPSPCTGNYRQVGIMDDSHKSYVRGQHRFVMAARLGTWEGWDEAHHLDTVPYNNCPINLSPRDRKGQFDETTRSNMSLAKIGKRSNFAKLTDDQVREIRKHIDEWTGQQTAFCVEIAEQLDVTYITIYNVIKQKVYKDVV